MPDPASPELTDHDRDELKLLYGSSVSEIAFFKQQQWVVTNYSIAIQAGAVAIGHSVGAALQSCERWLLILVVGAAVVGGLFVLSRLSDSVAVRRERLRNVRKSFGNPFHHAWYVPKHNDFVPFFLAFAQMTAGALACWLVICHS